VSTMTTDDDPVCTACGGTGAGCRLRLFCSGRRCCEHCDHRERHMNRRAGVNVTPTRPGQAGAGSEGGEAGTPFRLRPACAEHGYPFRPFHTKEKQ